MRPSVDACVRPSLPVHQSRAAVAPVGQAAQEPAHALKELARTELVRWKNSLEEFQCCQVQERKISPQPTTSRSRAMASLQFWTSREDSFPHIAWVAKRVLTTQPSSAESKRVFSRAGLVGTPHRMSLAPERLGQLVMLAFNPQWYALQDAKYYSA